MKTSKFYAVLSVVWVLVAYWLMWGFSYIVNRLFPALWWKASFNGTAFYLSAVFVVFVFFVVGALCALPGVSWFAFLLPVPFLLRYFHPCELSPVAFILCAYLAIIASSVIFSSKKTA